MTKDFCTITEYCTILHDTRVSQNVFFLFLQLQLNTFLHILPSCNTQHLIKGWHFNVIVLSHFLQSAMMLGPLVNWYLSLFLRQGEVLVFIFNHCECSSSSFLLICPCNLCMVKQPQTSNLVERIL